MFKSKINAGFTIIELIVVIAIISVLATIVFFNTSNFVNKSKDSSIKGNMSSLLTNSLAYYGDHSGNYKDFCADSATQTIFYAIDAISENVHCNEVIEDENGVVASWAFCAKLYIGSEKAWCADYAGTKKQIENAICDSAIFVCP